MKKSLAVSAAIALILSSFAIPASADTGADLDFGARVEKRLEALFGKADINLEERSRASAVKSSSEGRFNVSVTADMDDLPKGIEKRLEDGKPLPPGIVKILGRSEHGTSGNATTTEDTRAPLIFSVTANAGTSTATVRFFTNERTEASVRFGTNASLSGTSTAIASTHDGRVHRVLLTSLSADTQYFYRITATDESGNVKESAIFSFRTDLPDGTVTDTTAPRILAHFVVKTTDDSARVIFVTNEPADTKLFLGTSSPVMATGTPALADARLSSFHEAELRGLSANTNYVYTLAAKDAAGNTAIVSNATFRTQAD